MKPYLLFAGEQYYPRGGWHDYHGSFATYSKAVARAKEINKHWHHIVSIIDDTYDLVQHEYKNQQALSELFYGRQQ